MACNYCKEVGHFKNQCPKLRRFNYNNSGWRGGNNTGGRGGRGGGQRGKAAVQLVPEPDFYGIAGQDPSQGNVSLTKGTRESVHQGDHGQGRPEGETVSLGLHVRRANTSTGTAFSPDIEF
ncbi:uncharacterized protein LOC133708057 isoform X1 [Rosa rugosa]|uniref:uncharacterized protein LOC133708057 isoform X1 n=1 Tax=Rosa rugosa TaxID=74645 RepID=UPI002B40E87E|nr:uncharacterized protein LOC133708057 isoform X1 [Rosa rugosa]